MSYWFSSLDEPQSKLARKDICGMQSSEFILLDTKQCKKIYMEKTLVGTKERLTLQLHRPQELSLPQGGLTWSHGLCPLGHLPPSLQSSSAQRTGTIQYKTMLSQTDSVTE